MLVANRLIRRCSVVVLCLSAIPFVACTNSAEAQEDTQSESVAKASEASREHGGRFMDDVLKELKLRPEQQDAVDKLRADAKARHEPIKAAKRELMVALADQLEKGDVDRCGLQAQIDKIGAAVAKSYPDDRGMMERFHEILDPDQRVAFVDAIRDRGDKLEKAHDKGVMTDAIAKELNLSDDQKDRLGKIFAGLKEIKDAEPAHAAHRERMTKILDAFKTDHFVLDEIAPAKDVEAHATGKIKHMLWAGEAVIPVLNDEQRVHLAKLIREKVERHQHHDDDQGGARDEAPPTID